MTCSTRRSHARISTHSPPLCFLPPAGDPELLFGLSSQKLISSSTIIQIITIPGFFIRNIGYPVDNCSYNHLRFENDL